jgi:hypothetical protein
MRKWVVEMDAVARRVLGTAGQEREHVFSGGVAESPW